jgi:Aromatic-ring hydroxylase, C-terminal
MRAFLQWRDPDSNRGRHDFQLPQLATFSEPKALQIMRFIRIGHGRDFYAICGRSGLNWPRATLVRPDGVVAWRSAGPADRSEITQALATALASTS